MKKIKTIKFISFFIKILPGASSNSSGAELKTNFDKQNKLVIYEKKNMKKIVLSIKEFLINKVYFLQGALSNSSAAALRNNRYKPKKRLLIHDKKNKLIKFEQHMKLIGLTIKEFLIKRVCLLHRALINSLSVSLNTNRDKPKKINLLNNLLLNLGAGACVAPSEPLDVFIERILPISSKEWQDSLINIFPVPQGGKIFDYIFVLPEELILMAVLILIFVPQINAMNNYIHCFGWENIKEMGKAVIDWISDKIFGTLKLPEDFNKRPSLADFEYEDERPKSLIWSLMQELGWHIAGFILFIFVALHRICYDDHILVVGYDKEKERFIFETVYLEIPGKTLMEKLYNRKRINAEIRELRKKNLAEKEAKKAAASGNPAKYFEEKKLDEQFAEKHKECEKARRKIEEEIREADAIWLDRHWGENPPPAPRKK